LHYLEEDKEGRTVSVMINLHDVMRQHIDNMVDEAMGDGIGCDQLAQA